MTHKNSRPELKPLFAERMKELLGEDFENYVESLSSETPRWIRCNTLKISPKNLRERLEKQNWQISQPFKDFSEIMKVEGKLVEENSDKNINHIGNLGDNNSPEKELDKVSSGAESIVSEANVSLGEVGGETSSQLVKLGPGELGRSTEHILGYYYVQELASMLPVIALNPQPGDIVLDLCASPGSKTTQIAASMKNQGTIIANEVTLGRVKILASNTERCGVTNAILTKKEGASLCKKLDEINLRPNKVLIDAPCSGEGTLRTSKMTYKMWNINTVKKLSGVQKYLVSNAFEILADGGEMVYSTCTHAPEENEAIVTFMLENFKDRIKLEKINLPKEIKSRPGIQKWKGSKFPKEISLTCRIYPQDNDTEGFFIAKFKKINNDEEA